MWIVNYTLSDTVTSAVADSAFNINTATHDASTNSLSTNSLALVGAYSEFASTVNDTQRSTNTRSSALSTDVTADQ